MIVEGANYLYTRLKAFISISLIVLLSLQCVFRLGIITYFEANREYIATVLCINKEKPAMKCNGTCFLKQRLALTEESDKQQGRTLNEKTESSVFLITEFSYQPFSINLQTNAHYSFKRDVLNGFRNPSFRPPAVVLV